MLEGEKNVLTSHQTDNFTNSFYQRPIFFSGLITTLIKVKFLFTVTPHCQGNRPREEIKLSTRNQFWSWYRRGWTDHVLYLQPQRRSDLWWSREQTSWPSPVPLRVMTEGARVGSLATSKKIDFNCIYVGFFNRSKRFVFQSPNSPANARREIMLSRPYESILTRRNELCPKTMVPTHFGISSECWLAH